VLWPTTLARYPELKIILRSGALDIPESAMSSIDGVVSKGDGLEQLLEEIKKVRSI
jgi:hypothetical protein